MKGLLRRTYTMPVFMVVLWCLGPLARLPLLERPVRFAMRCFARLVLWSSAEGGREAPDKDPAPAHLARTWQRLMPTPPGRFPVVHADSQVAVGEIHLRCPLRGTGDRAACYRLMEFDRALVGAAGGELVVTESQSETGAAFCRVAIRTRRT